MQLPRVNIADWKPGCLGVPTFHCIRCFQRWMKSGGLTASCSEKEMRMEGPAMCITFQSTGDVTEKEMLVGGILGEDGKPVKIKVEAPKTIKKLLRMEKRKKLRKKKAKVKRAEMSRQIEQSKEQAGVGYERERENDTVGSRVSPSEFEDDVSDSSSSDEDLIDLPDIFKKQILQQTTKRSELASGRNKSEFQGEETAANKRKEATYSSSSSTFDLMSDSETDLAFLHNDGKYVESENQMNSTQNKRHVHAKQPSKSHEKSQQMSLRRKPNGESSQQSGSKINTSETCSSMSNGDNESSVCLTGPQRNSKSHPDKRKCRVTSIGEHLPSISGAESKAWGKTSINTKVSKYTRTRNSDSSLNKISSSKSLFSQASSSSSIGHDLLLPDIANSNSSSGSSLVGVNSSEGKKKEYNRQRRKSNNQHVRGKRKETRNKGSKGSSIHLPSLLDKTDSQSFTTHHNGPSSKSTRQSGHKGSWHKSVTGSSETTPHLPRLSQHKTSLVQQTVSGEWGNYDSSSYSERTSSGREKSYKSQEDKYYTEADHSNKSQINKFSDQNALGSTQSYAMTAVPDSPVNNNLAQSQSEHYTKNSTINQDGGAPNPSHRRTTSSAVDISSMQPTRSTALKKQTPKISNATVQDVLLPNHKNVDSRTNQMRIRRKSKWGDEMPQVQASTSSHIGSSFVQMQNQNSMRSASNTTIQRLPSFQDDIPRRFGQKLVKKSKKSESERKESQNYNSKDLGNVVGNSGVDNLEHDGSTTDGTARQKIRNNSSIQFDSGNGSKQSLASRILKRTQGQYIDNSNVPMPIMGRGGSPSQHTRPTSTGLGSRIAANPPVSNLLQDSTNTPQVMVRLKPLDPITNVIASEEMPVPQPADEATEPLTLENQTCDPEDQEDKESVDSGLDIISEESEEEEDSGDELDFEIRPIPELKEISPMSFTSAYAYSFYKLSGPYKKAYDKTHARTLQPLRVGRKRRPPKVRRKKAK